MNEVAISARLKLGIAGFFALALLTGWAASLGRFGDSRLAVETGRVARRDLAKTLTAAGEIRAARQVQVRADQSGRVAEILVAEGDTVEVGRPLLRIETAAPLAEASARAAALERMHSEAQAAAAVLAAGEAAEQAQQRVLAQAQAEQERSALLHAGALRLVEEGLISRNEYARSRAESRDADSRVKEAQANLARLQAQRTTLAARLEAAKRRAADGEAKLSLAGGAFRNHIVRAPIAGLIAGLSLEPGAAVYSGDPLLSLADMSAVYARILPEEADAGGVAPGQSVEIAVKGASTLPLHGQVTEAAASDGLFTIMAALSNPPDSLRPGTRCTVRITTAARPNALAIPLSAVSTREGRGAFVIEHGRASWRPIRTGLAANGWVEVLGGLNEGESVVTGDDSAVRSLQAETSVRVLTPNDSRL